MQALVNPGAYIRIVLNPVMFAAFIQRKNALPVLSAILAMTYLSYVSIPLIFLLGSEKAQTGFQTNHLQVATTAQSLEEKQPDYLLISDWHLFGQAVDGLSFPNGMVPETQLQLKLQGVFTLSEHDDYAHAIIETPDQIQKAYKINDALPGGATLKAIENDKIIILRNNQQESLALGRQKPE
jgi:general secretion pathway protein C